MLIDDIKDLMRSESLGINTFSMTYYDLLDAAFSRQNLLCINIENVAGLYESDILNKMAGKTKGEVCKTLYSISTPSSITWFEYPAKMFTSGSLLSKRHGVLVVATSIDEDIIPIEEFESAFCSKLDSQPSGRVMFVDVGLWGVNLSFSFVAVFVLVNEIGEIIYPEDKGDGVIHNPFVFKPLIDEEQWKQGVKEVGMDSISDISFENVLPAVWALNLINAKNIVLKKEEGKVKHRLNTKRQKQDKLPLVKMHTIDIVTPGQRVISPDGEFSEQREPTNSRPLHLVRGHLADYRFGKGLFGKHKGVFYIPQHARGSIDNGVVKKRYEVQPASEERRGK